VLNNIVVRAPINLDGAGAKPPTFNAAIYFDTGSANGTVSNNTILDVPIGIYLHDASYIKATANTISLTSQAGVRGHMDMGADGYLDHNEFTNNRFLPANVASGTFPVPPTVAKQLASTKIAWSLAVVLDDPLYSTATVVDQDHNVFSGNDILQLNDTSIPIARVNGSSLSAAGWRQLNVEREPLGRSPELYRLYLTTLDDHDLMQDGDFENGLTPPWKKYFSGATGTYGSVTLGTMPGCVNHCAVFAPQTINDALISPEVTMVSGNLYRVGFTASYEKNATVSQPGFVLAAPASGQAGSGLASPSGLNGADGETVSYEGFFNATSSLASTVNLASSPQSVIGFDSVSLRLVTGYTTSLRSDWAAYVYVPATVSPKSVDCGALGWPSGCAVTDVNGTAISLPASAASGTGTVYLRADSPYKR
jgi:parallel beta-helix repeat protein